MKSLDGDSIFSIFVNIDQEEFNDVKSLENPPSNFLLMGTVIRGVDNYFLLDQLYTNRYGERYFSVKDILKLKYFIQLRNYLRRINQFELKTASLLVDEFGKSTIVYVFQYLLSYFEEQEYYEDCIIVKKYFDIFTQNSLISQ